jgi:hypothetical protein
MEVHEFRPVVAKSVSREHEEWLAAAEGREPKPASPGDWAWQIRDVVAGEDVASGQAATEEAAHEAADAALHEARAAEKERLEGVVNPFGLDTAEQIQAAYDELPA